MYYKQKDKKLRKISIFFYYFFLITMSLSNLINPVYFPINGATEIVILAWTIELSMWVVLMTNLPNLSKSANVVDLVTLV